MANEAHIRIDEGIKRGPKKRYKHRPPIARDDSGRFLDAVPPELNPDEVLQLYLNKPKTSQIAKEVGIRRPTLIRWLREQRPEQWKLVQVIRALTKKEDGDEGIEDANDALMLARARELVKSAQWDLERLDSGNYGQKQELTVQVNHRLIVKDALGDSALELFKNVRGVALAHDQQVIDLPGDKLQQTSQSDQSGLKD